MTIYATIPNRAKYLKSLKEGNEQQIVSIDVGLRVGELLKISASKEQLWAIEKKLSEMKNQRRELFDALNIINDELIEEDKKQKGK